MSQINFALRPFQKSDLPQLVHHANNFKIANYLTNRFPYPYDEAAGLTFIEIATSKTPTHIFAITVDDKVVGGIGIHPKEDVWCKTAVLGYWLGEEWWGKGIISDAVAQMIPYSFQTFDINRIEAIVFEDNNASKRILEKNGFVLEARFEKTIFKNGVLKDEWVFGLRKK